MAPRAYDRSLRDEAMAETRQRIVDATIALHAEQGSSRTTYAMIAERASGSWTPRLRCTPSRARAAPPTR